MKPSIRWFDTLPSSHQYCEALSPAEVEEYSVVAVRQQTAGIGQRGNRWESAPGQNLTFSLLLKPTFLPTANQFRLTQAASLALLDFLSSFALPQTTYIKWPNDIYVGGDKLCGTLLSCHTAGETLSRATVSIGLNVNQTQFPSWVPNPTSLALLTGRQWPLDDLLDQLLQRLSQRYLQLRNLPHESLNEEYTRRLFRRGQTSTYLLNGEPIQATLIGVDRYGRLQLQLPSGEMAFFQMKEVQFVL